MTEERIGLLCNLAANITSDNNSLKLLRSHYLMRCNEVTKGYGLPVKYFSSKSRCPHCCLEWSRDTKVNVRPIKLSRRQRQKQKGDLNRRNEMEQVCTFCKKTTTTQLVKPEKTYMKLTTKESCKIIKVNSKIKQQIKAEKKAQKNSKELNESKIEVKKNAVINVYSNAYDVFSLKNDKNTIASAIKEPVKIIKNNKKKKDKYAGLCQKAVLASARLKQQKELQQNTNQSKLNLFLKPSVG